MLVCEGFILTYSTRGFSFWTAVRDCIIEPDLSISWSSGTRERDGERKEPR